MIHLECDNDETLMLALGVTRNQMSHHAGKGRVSKALAQSPRELDLGLVDQDPGQPPPKYLREFRVVESAEELGLVLYEHPVDQKRLVEIRPDLEPWLYLAGPAVGVRPVDHRLSERHSGLHRAAKRLRTNLMDYLAACRRADSPHLSRLASWIEPFAG